MQNRIFAGAVRAVLMLALVGCLLPAAVAAPTRPTGPAAFQADNIDSLILHPRATYAWEYSLGPTYGEVREDRANDPSILRMDVGSFDLSVGSPAFPAELKTALRLGSVDSQYFVLTAQPRPEGMMAFLALRDSIVKAGGAVVQELGGTNFVVRLNQAAYAVVQNHPEVRALEPYHAAFKLNPNIGRAPLPDAQAALSDVYHLDIQLFAGEDSAAVARAIRALGGNVLSVTTDVISAEVHRNKLAAIAALEPVRKIYENIPVFAQGAETTAVMQVGTWQGSSASSFIYHNDRVNGGGFTGTCTTSGLVCQGNQDCPSPQTCTGSGAAQVLMILDTGIQLDAGDLSDTRTAAGAASATHRKVKVYDTVNAFGGSGDLLGCDLPALGGFTHGHTVAATALGNATAVPVRYGAGWVKTDGLGVAWPVDGVAPRAILVAYDAQSTPVSGTCSDPANAGLSPGTIYNGIGASSSLEVAYATHGARTFNFSWGSVNNPTYATNAQRVDNFLNDRPDAMLFIAAGNDGKDATTDGVPDPGSISDPATAKNAVVVGATGNTSIPFNGANEEDRWAAGNVSGSGVGPATATSLRVAPLLMAPGTDFGAIGGNMGFDSEYSCLSSDNNQANPVECDVIQQRDGTSFSSPAAAGAALLVRDYFAQGFYPDGTAGNPGNAGDRVANISGALVKALLVASADWLDASDPDPNIPDTNASGGNLSKDYRFNNEQGYGRIQLSNALPLQSSGLTPIGLIVSDGAQAGSRVDISGLDGAINVAAAQTDTGTFTVCDDSKELRVALVWIDATGENLVNNLDLELCPPSNPTCTVSGTTNVTSKVYYGNYFTDDNNKNDLIDAGEECNFTFLTGAQSNFDSSPWSMPACSNSAGGKDARNPVEAIFLSPDARLDGTGANADKQTETGTWTVKVKAVSGTNVNQKYAVVVTGGVCSGSSVQFDASSVHCNDGARVIVNEKDEAGTDPAAGLTVGEVASRTTVEVVDLGADRALGTGDDTVVDSEAVTYGAPTGLKFTSNALPLSDTAVGDPNDGILAARNGQVLRVTYADETSGVADPNKRRSNNSAVNCQSSVAIGGVAFAQFGLDTSFLVNGGCERDGRNLFTFGFPDRYMDSGERVGFSVAFQSLEAETLTDVKVSLRCVLVDADSAADCLPGTTTCADPNRSNNAGCGAAVQVLDSPKSIGDLPPGNVGQPAFTIQLGTITGNPRVEFLVGVSSSKSGRAAESLLVVRTNLNSDEQSFFYSTDYPTGAATPGVPYPELRDYNNSETIENPTTNAGDFDKDYRFESVSWSSLQATGRNGSIQPWNFESGKQGWTVGRNNTSTPLIAETIANWGEDLNFNGFLDYYCSLNKAVSCPGPVGNCGRCSGNTNIICVPPDAAAVCSGIGVCSADAVLGACVTDEDRDPINGSLNDNWGTAGGCGWQTNGSVSNGAITGGIWHTGEIDTENVGNCLYSGTFGGGSCQNYETLTGQARTKRTWDMLLSPLVAKVNQCNTDIGALPASCGGVFDQANDKVFTVEFIDWDWNMAMDLKDELVQIRWEFDTDTAKSAPIDLFNDAVVLNALGGNQGPISAGNSPLTNGFQVFAPFATANPGVSQNGSVGNNRVGQNPCYFEQNSRTAPLHMAEPLDDDVDNNSAGGVDEYVRPNGPIRNFDQQEVNGPDMRFSTLEDIYGPSGDTFQAALGFRVFEGDATISPTTSYGVGVDDMRIMWREYKLIEDATDCGTSGSCASIVVDSDNIFDGNGVLTVRILDSSPYGMTAPANKNDCNGNGVFTDGVDDTDCDNNGTNDVLVKVTSLPEPLGETFIANQAASGIYLVQVPVSATANATGVIYLQDGGPNNPEVTVQYNDRWDGTASGNVCQNDSNPVEQGLITEGIDVVTITAGVSVISFRLVESNGDIDGFPDTNETFNLFLTVSNKTNIPLTNVVVQVSSADPKIDCILTGVSVIPSMDGRGGANAIKETPTAFVLHISPSADRAGAVPAAACNAGVCTNGAGACASAANCVKTTFDTYAALLNVSVSADQFDVNAQPQSIGLDLDLNSANPVGATAQFVEGFEAGFGNFTFLNLDGNLASNSASNGARCQYNDPDYPNSNSYGDTECYVGFQAGQSPINDWHAHTTAAPDGGRAYLGTASLHYGKHTPGNPGNDTYGLSQLDAVRTKVNVNLAARICQNDPAANKRSCNSAADCLSVGGGPCVSASPLFSFKHQVSTTDNRGTNTPAGQAADRAAVAAQIVGSPIYQKLTPYENVYDVQGTDNFSNCLFDPTDDGNTEDDYFDPTDPGRRFGPSSTCFPEFVFSFIGDTDSAFSPSQIGRADVGPGLPGALGLGTWVESKFDLSRFRGRAIRLRYVFTTIKVSDLATLQDLFMWNPVPYDDGWYIDDVRVTQTLGNSASTVTTDAANNAGLDTCPAAACTALTAGISVNPTSTNTPGQPLTISAASTTYDRCSNGTILYRFFVDANLDGDYDAGTDTEIRGFGAGTAVVDAPGTTTRYGVTARCSEGGTGTCTGSNATATYTVNCSPPPAVFDGALWWAKIGFSNKTTLSLPPYGEITDAVKGNLIALRTTGTFASSSPVCLANNSGSYTLVDAANPATGGGFYYLFRGQTLCNDNTNYSTFSSKEQGQPNERNTEIGATCAP